MRQEWQTSEELFAQSQKLVSRDHSGSSLQNRDNEQKHNHIESLRHYVKV